MSLKMHLLQYKFKMPPYPPRRYAITRTPFSVRSVFALHVTNSVSIAPEAVQDRVIVKRRLCAPVPRTRISFFPLTSIVVLDGISKHMGASSMLMMRLESNSCCIRCALTSSKNLLTLASNWAGNFCCTDV